jgi:hypothetical protein
MSSIDLRSLSSVETMYRLNFYENNAILSHVCVAIGIYTHIMYRYTMASIQKVKVGPYTSYQIVESRLVNGKLRPIPLLH